MVDYLENGQLIIELWGSQKEASLPSTKAGAKGAAPAAGGKKEPPSKSTKELMAAEKAKVGLLAVQLFEVQSHLYTIYGHILILHFTKSFVFFMQLLLEVFK